MMSEPYSKHTSLPYFVCVCVCPCILARLCLPVGHAEEHRNWIKNCFCGEGVHLRIKTWLLRESFNLVLCPCHESLAIRGRAYSWCRVKCMSTLPHFPDACLALRLHCKVFLCKICLVAGTNYAAFRFHVKVKKKKVVCSCSVMMLWCVIYPWTHGCLY